MVIEVGVVVVGYDVMLLLLSMGLGMRIVVCDGS